jgi:hypothetical protein
MDQGLGHRNAGMSKDDVATTAARHLFRCIWKATVPRNQEFEGFFATVSRVNVDGQKP